MSKAVIFFLFCAIVSAIHASAAPCASQKASGTPNFDHCKKHFVEGFIPPDRTGEKPAAFQQICQGEEGYFATLYNTKLKMPEYSAYMVTSEQAKQALVETARTMPRPRHWNYSAVLPVNQQASCDNILWNGQEGRYDKGHLCPNDIMQHSRKSQLATFTITNAVPQLDRCNSPSWSSLEGAITNWIARHHDLYIITGVAHPRQNGFTKPLRDSNEIVPKHIWTVICDAKNHQSAGFIGLASEPYCGCTVQEYRTVREVEALFGAKLIPTSCKTGEVKASHWAFFGGEHAAEADAEAEACETGDGSESCQ